VEGVEDDVDDEEAVDGADDVVGEAELADDELLPPTAAALKSANGCSVVGLTAKTIPDWLQWVPVLQ
jgi:hypothetical protein